MIPTGNTPLFESIAAYFRKMIARGAFPQGAPLPSVREVAMTEKVNPNTVVRAYALLMEEGVIESIPKKGYFVVSGNAGRVELEQTLRTLLREGFSKEEIRRALDQMEGETA